GLHMGLHSGTKAMPLSAAKTIDQRYLFWGAAALVIACVLGIRLFLGFEFPIPWNDETAFIAQAFEFSQTGSFFVWGLNQERPVLWMPPGYMLLLAGVYKAFGYSFEISRWVSCLLYIGAFLIVWHIVRSRLAGWWRLLALGFVLVAFLSPYALAISNIARMESLYVLLFMLSLLAAVQGRPVLGLALVLVTATVHFNAVYFLLPFAVLIGWTLVRRESLVVGPGELLALVLAVLALTAYGLFVIKHIDAFWQDMQFQFAFKLGSPVMGGREGWMLLGGLLLLSLGQLLLHRRFGTEVLLSLYGISFIAMALNGHSMWYDFAYALGFMLLLAGVLASLSACRGRALRIAGVLVLAGLASQLGYYAWRETPQFAPLTANAGMFSRDFLPAGELQRVRDFIATLPPKSTLSFGYSGVEPFFFADLAKVGALWSIPGHSVIQVFPARAVDFRVLCDSAMFPGYLFAYDWDGYPRTGADKGCSIIPLKK
ncbi:MAG: ArnT family glycosyltransferase, partial [Gammaproteobacteria bacterium]